MMKVSRSCLRCLGFGWPKSESVYLLALSCVLGVEFEDRWWMWRLIRNSVSIPFLFGFDYGSCWSCWWLWRLEIPKVRWEYLSRLPLFEILHPKVKSRGDNWELEFNRLRRGLSCTCI